MKPTYEELEVDIAFLKVEIAQLKYALTGRTVSCDFCNQAARERDEARAEASNALSPMRAAEACTARATARAERAEKALAEAQPVLDAVVAHRWGKGADAHRANDLLRDYADSRRYHTTRANGGAPRW